MSVFRVCENGQCTGVTNGTHGTTSEMKKSKHPELGMFLFFTVQQENLLSVILEVQQENVHFL